MTDMQQQVLSDILASVSVGIFDAMKFQRTEEARDILIGMGKRVETIAALTLAATWLERFDQAHIQWYRAWKIDSAPKRVFDETSRFHRSNVQNAILDELVPLHQMLLAIAAQSNPFDRQYWMDIAGSVHSVAMKSLDERYHDDWQSHRAYQMGGLPKQSPSAKMMNVLGL